MSSKLIYIWVYLRKKHGEKNKDNRTRCKVSLRHPTERRDRRKSQISTFVNFIHQKDAGIAMSMVKRIIDSMNAPIYTVHDNFITRLPYASELSKWYLDVFLDGQNHYFCPLSILNHYLIDNLYYYTKPDSRPPIEKPIPPAELRKVLEN